VSNLCAGNDWSRVAGVERRGSKRAFHIWALRVSSLNALRNPMIDVEIQLLHV
jgi:hypothetical protein